MLAFRSVVQTVGGSLVWVRERESKAESARYATKTMSNVNKCSRQLVSPCLVYIRTRRTLACSFVTYSLFALSLSLSLSSGTWRWLRLLLRVVVSRRSLPPFAERLFKSSAKPPFVCMRVARSIIERVVVASQRVARFCFLLFCISKYIFVVFVFASLHFHFHFLALVACVPLALQTCFVYSLIWLGALSPTRVCPVPFWPACFTCHIRHKLQKVCSFVTTHIQTHISVSHNSNIFVGFVAVVSIQSPPLPHTQRAASQPQQCLSVSHSVSLSFIHLAARVQASSQLAARSSLSVRCFFLLQGKHASKVARDSLAIKAFNLSCA